MTTAATFDELRSACATHNRAGRHEEALAAAEEAWQRFPARRDFTWYLVAYTNMALGRPSDAMAAIETAEAEGRVWRASLLRIRELDPLREEPRFIALQDRLRARIAARGYQPGLLVAQPEPPDPGAPLLLGLHGATSTAEEYHGHWLPAVGLGCIVASAQSTQPAADHAFCWDDRDQVRRDLAAVLPDLPPHGGVVLTGFSQGAAIAVELAVAGDVVPARGVIGVGPAFPGSADLTAAQRPLDVVLLYGADDSWGATVPGAVDGLRAAGHRVHVAEVPGLGHEFPGDFTDRLPSLLAAAGIASHQLVTPDEARTGD